MPVLTLNNNVFRITDMVVDLDEKGYYVRLNMGHCDAVVLCVCQQRPILQQDLTLTEAELQKLFMGGQMEFADKGFSLQGVTRQQIAGSSRYRNFGLKPPAYVQVWGMKQGGSGPELLCPANVESQMCRVPVGYTYTCEGDTVYVKINQFEGYQDGDLMYRVPGHLGIPIPKDFINLSIPLRPGTSVEVVPSPAAEGKYTYKSAL